MPCLQPKTVAFTESKISQDGLIWGQVTMLINDPTTPNTELWENCPHPQQRLVGKREATHRGDSFTGAFKFLLQHINHPLSAHRLGMNALGPLHSGHSKMISISLISPTQSCIIQPYPCNMHLRLMPSALILNKT